MHTGFLKKKIILAVLLITTVFKFSAYATAEAFSSDSIAKKDSIQINNTTSKKSFLDSKVNYNATDSLIIDLDNKRAYLYNNAVVTYEDLKLTAGYIEIDFGKKLVYSKGIKDSTGKIVQKPVSEQAGEKFTAGEITYNFETKKGKIKDVITQQGDGYVHGSDIKKDTNNVYYVAKGKYTTCNLEDPHFYIGAKKIKVIPDDKIITGPAQLVIMDIPTPLGIPFGYFPNKKGRASGILLPTYGESKVWGFFLKDGGFYYGKNEYFDLALRGDIYSNGSFKASSLINYNKRYKFNGSNSFAYSRYVFKDKEFKDSIKNDFFIRWSHNNDIKSKPGSRFSANVNAGSSNFNKYNGNTIGASGTYLTNTFQSNIAYAKTFIGTPFNLSVNARHSQNTITKKTDMSLPDVALTMNRIFPFKNLTSTGTFGHEALEKLSVNATLNARNDISEYDSILYNDKYIHQTIKTMNNGAKLTTPVSTSINLFKYFVLTPSFNPNAYLNLKTIEKRFDKLSNKVITDTLNGTKVVYDYNYSARLTTLLYGNYYFKTKRLKQIRHVITPAVTGTYKPDFSQNKYGVYKTVQSDTLGNTQQYSSFQNGIFGSPSAGKATSIGFNVNNTLEAKIKSDTDSGATTKKVMLIENFNFGASYNAAAKTQKWSNISLAARTTLFKKLSVNSTASLDPYQLDSTGKKNEKFEWQNNRIGRLTNANIALGTSFKSKSKNKPQTTSDPAFQDELDYINKHPEAYVDFNIPWNFSVAYNINYKKEFETTTLAFKKTVSQALTVNGDLNLTKKWKISARTGYDFTSGKLSFTSIDVYRDLHCWQLNFNWIPFGLRQSYSLTINVKSSMLSDLKLSRRRQWQDYQ